jgi:hypothetical protein
MKWRSLPKWVGVGVLFLIGTIQPGVAIPGQSIDAAESWILANPTLRPARGEKFFIRKSDTPAHRFEFRASPLPPGRITALGRGGMVMSEEISLYDMTNGVTKERLAESLRVVYGSSIYQDYASGLVVYTYPPNSALRGELRQGRRFAYWLEIAQRNDGFAYVGRATVFLNRDLPKLESELRNR